MHTNHKHQLDVSVAGKLAALLIAQKLLNNKLCIGAFWMV